MDKIDALEKLNIVRTNNKTVMIVAGVIGILLLIIGLIFAYARSKNKGKINRKNKRKHYFDDYEEDVLLDMEIKNEMDEF